MRKIIIGFFLLLASIASKAQWQKFTLPLDDYEDLYGITFINNTSFFICSNTEVTKTINSGVSWQAAPVTGLFLANTLKDIKFSSANTGVLTGVFNLTNDEIVLSTANGGSSWNNAYQNTPASYGNEFNAIDMNGNNVLVVGTGGHILKSENGGSSYTTKASGTKELKDVKYISSSKALCVGDNTLLRSSNGGDTWTSDSGYSTFFLNSISFPSAGVIYISASNGQLFQSNNSGASFTAISTGFAINSIAAANIDTIFIGTGNGIYVSLNGGIYWEQFKSTKAYNIHKLEINDNKVYALCKNATLLVLDISAMHPEPIASFSMSANSICLGDSVSFGNSTSPIPGHTYQWKIDDNIFSTQYHSGIRLNTAGTYTVSLIVSHGLGADTVRKTITVYGHTLNTFTLMAFSDSVCKGMMVDFSVPNSQIGATYRLRKGFSTISSAVAGTGGILYFSSSSAINGTTVFNIKAAASNFCYTDSLILYKSISVYSNTTIPTAACIPTANYCASSGITNVSFGQINNTTSTLGTNYFDYSCCQHTTVIWGSTYTISITTLNTSGEYVKVWIDYDNNGAFNNTSELVFSGSGHSIRGNITISPTGNIYTQVLRMRVASAVVANDISNSCSSSFCGQMEDYALTIVPAPVQPTSVFSYTLATICATSATFSNTTYNLTSCTWDFGDGTPETSLFNPTHIFSVTGTYSVSLISYNPYGSDTMTQILNINNPRVPVPSVCTPLIWTGYVGTLYNFKFGSLITTSTPSGYNDFTCTKQIHVNAESSYAMSTSYTFGSSGCASFRAWIDYNNDGSFSQSELINGSSNTICSGAASSIYVPVTIIGTVVQNTPLRMRTLVYDSGYDGWIYTGCQLTGIHGGQILDFTVFVDPPLPATANFVANPTVSCSSNYVSFNNSSSNATSFLWDFGNGTTSTVKNPVYNYSVAGTYTVKLVAGNSLYSDSIIRNNYITINQALPVPIITYSLNQLSTTAIAPSYQWYLSGSPISGATSYSCTLTQDGIYKLVITNNNGCTTSSATYSHYPVRPNFSFPSYVCGTAYAMLVNSSTNATTYSIDWGDGKFLNGWNGTGGPLHSYTVVGTYYVKLTACNSSGVCDSLTKSIIASTYLPVPVITQNGSVLSTTTIATSYQWYYNTTMLAGATSSSYNPTQDGTYKVIVSNNGCTTSSASYSYYPPHIYFQADTLAYCGVSSANTSFSNTTINAITYLWDFGDGDTSTLKNPSHTYLAPGKYSVKLKATNSNNMRDSIIKTNYISITPLLPTVHVSPNSSVCQGSYTTLTANGTNSYLWLPDNLTGNSVSVAPYYPTQYIVIGTDTNGCKDSDTVWVNVNPLPVINISPDITICEGSSVTLTAKGGSSYIWTPGNSTGSSISVSPTLSVLYTVIGTNTLGCSDYATTYVTVNPLPEIPIITEIYDTLFSSAAYGNQWYRNNVILSGETNDRLTLFQNGAYKVIVDEGYGCISTSSLFNITALGISKQNTGNDKIFIYPNPTNGNVRIKYSLSDKNLVIIELYDVIGKKIKSISNSTQSFGFHSIEINMNEFPKGIYFLKGNIGKDVFTEKLVVQ